MSQGQLQETISKTDTAQPQFWLAIAEGIIVNSFAIACINIERI